MSPSEPGSPDAPRPDDVTRRTHLANERTFLAWWRTGLGALAAGVGAGRVVPALTHGTRWPYLIVGAGFTLLGIVCIVYANLRHREVDESLRRGEFAPPDARLIAGLTIAASILGVVALTIVVAGDWG